ncbi:IPT/TIG domain-containing protein [Tenacibaculum sp. nBUS_03]|uniref:IPT/TIG domain-containing protein n=1 Tax=Tenacibaculum sp. nBUS_03 TaxID=3395320 RepID=UPI003EB7504E
MCLRKIYLIVLLSLLFSNCSSEKTIPPNNNSVKVETLSSKILPEGGVELTGSIKNVELELDYGFVIASDKNQTQNYPVITKTISGIKNGEFSLKIKNDLHKNQQYYFNAFAYTNNRKIYGIEKSFTSQGSTNPIIESITPSIAHLGDTIIIKGKNFSNDFSVLFNKTKASILIKSDSLTKAIVPTYPSGLRFSKITLEKTTGELDSVDFKLYEPVVYSIDPKLVHGSDVLTFKGDHFDLRKNANKVRMMFHSNYTFLEIISSTRNELKVKAPIHYYEFKPRFKLTSQAKEIDVNNFLEVKIPTITACPKTIKFDTEYIVEGNNFPNIGYSFRPFSVKINSYSNVKIDKATKEKLTLSISKNTPLRDFYIKSFSIEYLGKTTKFDTEVYVDEPMISVNNQETIKTHTYNGSLFGLVYDFNNRGYFISKFDEIKKEFTIDPRNKLPTNLINTKFIAFYKDTLVFLAYENNINKLYSYNFSNKTTKALADFPGENRLNALIEVVNDHLYFGLGSFNYYPVKYFNDIWKYSFSQNTWTKAINFVEINSINKAKKNPISFGVGNKLFFGAGQDGYNSDFWVYDTSTNKITKRASLPFQKSEYSTIHPVLKDNKIFVFFDYLYSYDINTDKWEIHNNFKDYGVKSGLFVHDNHIYKYSRKHGSGDYTHKLNNNYF